MRDLDALNLGFARIEAAQACRNLMGKYSYYHTAELHRDYVELWADRDDCVLQMPWGRYYGIEGVRKCYLRDHGDVYDRAEKAGIYEKPKTAGYGVPLHSMDTEVLEVAADGQTAKGCWLCPGHETLPGFGGPPPEPGEDGKPQPPGPMGGSMEPDFENSICEWAWSKYAVDFIKDANGEWKIWHMELFPLFKAEWDEPWTAHEQPDYERFRQMGMDMTGAMCYVWGKDVVYPRDQPDPPRPYTTFSDVQSCCERGEK